MFLQHLCEYATQIGRLPPPMHQSVLIRYIIQLNENGHFLGIIDCADENKRGLMKLAPDCKRSSAIKPKLLADNAEYTLGLPRKESDPARVRSQHAAYVQLVQDCAAITHEPTVEAIVHFLTTHNLDQVIRQPDFDPTANITFEVGEVQPIALSPVQAYWAKVSAIGYIEHSMQCLVCGEIRPPVKRLPILIKGIPGGQSSGMTLISANAAAFESYGLEASLIAPTCEDCGQRFGNALNVLLRQPETHLIIPPLVYIFWTAKPSEFSVVSSISSPTPDKVRHFLTATERGKASASRFDTTPFYAAALSASGARIVIRDWIETTLGDVQGNMERYFAFQRIADEWGGEQAYYFPLRQLVEATVRRGGKEEPAAQVGQALLHMALHGGSLPHWLLYQILRRTRAGQGVQAVQAALIKMVLLSQQEVLWSGQTLSQDQTTIEFDIERGNEMAELDLSCKDAAYVCGRLLAELEEIQYQALGKVNSNIIGRYYGTASSAPASVFARLLRGTQHHLAKISQDKEGAFKALDKQLQEILSMLSDFPPTLDLIGQGRFALGYYHQKAANRLAARVGAANKASQQPAAALLEDDDYKSITDAEAMSQQDESDVSTTNAE